MALAGWTATLSRSGVLQVKIRPSGHIPVGKYGPSDTLGRPPGSIP
jgi:hypothetical protein